MKNLSRRRFLEDSMFATAAAAVAGVSRSVSADEETQSKSPNERLNVAVIGAHGRGWEHLQNYAKRRDTEVTVICDVDSSVGQSKCAQVAELQGTKPTFVQDLRRVFDDPDVDIVTIATPNHWHALASIWAMQAGKDVYVEKPVSHNVNEGRRIVETARKYQRICQTGTQSRSMSGMREAIAYLQSGKLGDVKVGRGLCYKPRGSIGAKGAYGVSPTLDYNLWSGPAPVEPITRQQFHYDWHYFWKYGNGDLGNQGVHHMDIIRWGMGFNSLCNSVLSYGGRFGYEDAGETANTQVIVLDYGPKSLVFEVRGLKTNELKGTRVGAIFEGTEGYLVCPTYDSGTVFDRNGEKVASFAGGGNHHENFLKAVRSRKVEDLHADILEGHLSSALCHLANISFQLGEQMSNEAAIERLESINTTEDVQNTLERTVTHLAENDVKIDREVKFQVGQHLRFDPRTEQFINHAKADALLTREYRAPFEVPAAGHL